MAQAVETENFKNKYAEQNMGLIYFMYQGGF